MPLRGGLERRVAGWVEAGILSAGQGQQIVEFEEAAPGRSHRVLTILAVLGAALVFLGIVLVISQNWDEIGRLPKLATGIVLLVACLGGGYWVRNGPLGLVRTGDALLLLGTGVLFGNLALISQQYHIEFNPAPAAVAGPLLGDRVRLPLHLAQPRLRRRGAVRDLVDHGEPTRRLPA